MIAPHDPRPAHLAESLRARPDGWSEADVSRIASALVFYPSIKAPIGEATVNGLRGYVWMEPTEEGGAMLSVYGPFGTVLWRERVAA